MSILIYESAYYYDLPIFRKIKPVTASIRLGDVTMLDRVQILLTLCMIIYRFRRTDRNVWFDFKKWSLEIALDRAEPADEISKLLSDIAMHFKILNVMLLWYSKLPQMFFFFNIFF